MPAMRYGISFAHPACFTVDNSFAKAPTMAGSKQWGSPVPLSPPSRMSVANLGTLLPTLLFSLKWLLRGNLGTDNNFFPCYPLGYNPLVSYNITLLLNLRY